MKHSLKLFILIFVISCTKPCTTEPPIYFMYRQWFRIETPNLDPIKYRFYEDGTMHEYNNSYSKVYESCLDGDEVTLRLGCNVRHWRLKVIEENMLQVIENKIDTFIIVAK